MNRGQVAALKAMGIEMWVRRAPPAEPVESRPGRRVAGRPDAPVGVVVVWPGEFRISEEHEGGALVRKILGALKIPRSSFSILHADDATDLAEVIERVKDNGSATVLCLADEPVDRSEGVIQLPSLGRMLRDPSAKKPAWAALKPLVGRLGGS